MKIIAINGSPRPNGNTVTLLERAMKGARSRGAETKRVDLYRLNYKGCVSCFYCKRKDKPHGTCAVRDDLSPILTELKETDALLLRSPIYYDNITSGMAASVLQLHLARTSGAGTPVYHQHVPIRSLPAAQPAPVRRWIFCASAKVLPLYE